MLPSLMSSAPIKLLAVGWTAIRALNTCRTFPAEQCYIALSNDAVVLRASSADHKLFLWQNPATGEYRNTIVEKQPATPHQSDGLAQLVQPGDQVFLITGFGQDAEAAQMAELAAQAELACGLVYVIGTAPRGPGYTKKQQIAQSQIKQLKLHPFPLHLIYFEQKLLFKQSSPDTEIMALHTIVDRMLIQAVQQITGSRI